MTGYPHPVNPGQTHWEGCWQERGHHNCAVARVRELEAKVEELTHYLNDEWLCDSCGKWFDCTVDRHGTDCDLCKPCLDKWEDGEL